MPLVLIYSQGNRGYGEELANIIRSDSRLEAEVIVLSDPELFRAMIYFPYVKVLVGVFNHDKDEGMGEHLKTFFDEGGGIIGMGFAGWQSTTRNASNDVFALNASYYLTGEYDRNSGTFSHTLNIDERNKINQDIGSFSIRTQRIIMHIDKETGELVPPGNENDVTVLYRESTRGAPALLVHESQGTCITFAGFTGDSIPDVPTYFGHFTSQEEFRILFSNSVLYAWNRENRYQDKSTQWESDSTDYEEEMMQVKDQVRRASENQKQILYLRYALVILAVGATLAMVYRYCFTSTSRQGDLDNG